MSVYFITNYTVTDAEGYGAYSAAVPATFEGIESIRHAAGEPIPLEGSAIGERLVVLEFPSREEFDRWYQSDAYQAIVAMRTDNTEGFTLLIDGMDR